MQVKCKVSGKTLKDFYKRQCPHAKEQSLPRKPIGIEKLVMYSDAILF